MKKLFLLPVVALVLIFSSCGADSETVNAMADEMCTVMEKYDADDPMTMLDAASEMLEISTKDEYKKITESQLMSAMKDKCPEGAQKMKELSESAE